MGKRNKKNKKEIKKNKKKVKTEKSTRRKETSTNRIAEQKITTTSKESFDGNGEIAIKEVNCRICVPFIVLGMSSVIYNNRSGKIFTGYKTGSRWVTKKKSVLLLLLIYFVTGWIKDDESSRHRVTIFESTITCMTPEDVCSWTKKGMTEYYFLDNSRKVCVPLTMSVEDMHSAQPRKVPGGASQKKKQGPSSNQDQGSKKRIGNPTNKERGAEGTTARGLLKETRVENPSRRKPELQRLSCKNNNERDVDWYFVYKIPKGRQHMNHAGTEFYYLDNMQNNFQRPNVNLDERSQAVYFTLNQIFRQDSQVEYFMYNDSPPADGTRNTNARKLGHAKGVVAFDNETGFWIIHSVRNFPNTSFYQWPSTAKPYGQSILCITFAVSNKKIIFEQLKVIQPHVYHHNIPDGLKVFSETPECRYQKRNFSSLGKTELLHLAIHSTLYADFYDMVAHDLNCNLWTSTWQGISSPSCVGRYHVESISETKFLHAPNLSTNSDHSKWAICDVENNRRNKYICVGDLNRKKLKYSRGGGTMCAKLPIVWQQYYNAVEEVHGCP